LDVWVEATPENATRVMHALAAFGAPMQDVAQEAFSKPGVTYQMGIAPVRIDVLTELSGVTFQEAWADRISGPFGDVTEDFIGREVRNKRATGRPGISPT
jgi:hypothetical protein